MANMIARLGVVLGLDSAEFSKGIEGASKKLDEFATKAVTAGRVAATALVAASISALRYADEIADVAKANDLAIDSVVKLSNALALAGGKSEDAGKLLAGFTNFVDKAADGSLEAQKSFNKIGVSLKDLGQLSSDQLMDKTLRALVSIEDPITRNAKAMEIFGKAAKGVDMRELLSQMEKAESLSRDQARAVEYAAEVYDELVKGIQQLKLMLTVELGPPLKATMDFFKQMGADVQFFGNIFKSVFQTVAVLAANISFVIKTLVQDFAAMGSAAKAVFSGDFAKVGEIYREAVARAEKDRLALDTAEQKILGTGDGRRGMDDPRVLGGVTTPGRRVTKAKDPEEEKRRKELEKHLEFVRRKQAEGLEEAQKNNREMAEYNTRVERAGLALKAVQELDSARLELNRKIFQIELNTARLLPEEVEYQRSLLELEFEHEQVLKRIEAMELDADARREANLRETENYYERIRQAYERMTDRMSARQGSFAEGFTQKMTDFIRDLPTQLELGQQAFDSVLGNMESALDRFVQTGKLSFKDLARSIIQDLIRIQLRAQMTALFSRFVGSFLGSDTTTLPTGDFARLDRRAAGGPVESNTPYMVGERGPEIFVPRGAGAIVPNHQMSAVGGVTNITNNYIDAIDVQSFEQRILGSSNTVWAANQYAQKSLATGRGRT